MTKIGVLGAGISGLTTAYYLKKAGCDVTIIEADNKCGGVMQTENKNGFYMELGPNTVLYNKPSIRKLIQDLGIENELVFPGEKAKKRFILKNGKLLMLPSSPKDFFSSKALSFSGKLRVVREMFIKVSKNGEQESIADFATRRFGKEAYNNFFLPFVSGSSAGNPEKVSLRYAFPDLYHLEKEYGSVIKGMMAKAKEAKGKPKDEKKGIFSFEKGLAHLVEKLQDELSSELIFNTNITKIKKEGEQFTVRTLQEGKEKDFTFDYLVSTLPAYILADIIGSASDYLKRALRQVYYAPICKVYLGYKKQDLGVQPEGFGFLTAGGEGSQVLGALYNSQMFENKSPKDVELLTVMIGGACFDGLTNRPKKEIEQIAKDEMKNIFQAKEQPVFTYFHKFERAIPQYGLRHADLLEAIEKFEKETGNFIVGGNFIGGISVPNCIENGIKNSEKICNQLNKG